MATGQSDIDIKLPPTAFREFSAIAEHAGQLAEIEACARKVGPAPNREAIARKIADALSLPRSDVRHIVNGLINLQRVRLSQNIDVDELWEVVFSAVQGQASNEWKTATLDSLKNAKKELTSALRELTADHPLSICSKAEQLTFKHQNVLTASHIITDLRPVFNESAEDIQEAVIVHRLWIEYFDSRKKNRIEFALDADDVAQLRQWCDRAERKAVTLSNAVKSLPWPTNVAGRDWPNEES